MKAWALLSPHERAVATSKTAEELQTAVAEVLAEGSPTIAVDATLNAEEEAAWINLIQDIIIAMQIRRRDRRHMPEARYQKEPSRNGQMQPTV